VERERDVRPQMNTDGQGWGSLVNGHWSLVSDQNQKLGKQKAQTGNAGRDGGNVKREAPSKQEKKLKELNEVDGSNGLNELREVHEAEPNQHRLHRVSGRRSATYGVMLGATTTVALPW